MGPILPTIVGIGLENGHAVTGGIGSALRREYTVVGDVVNLQNEIAGAISKGKVNVRGREEGIEIYQLA